MARRDALLLGLLVVIAAAGVVYVAGRREAPPPAVDDDRAPTDRRDRDAGTPTPGAGPDATAPPLSPGGAPRTAPPPAGQPRGERVIEGRVTDAAERPVADATVEARALPPPSEGSRPPLVATTDADGRFALVGLAAGPWAVLARHAGYAGAMPVVVEAGATGLALRLGTLGWVEGTVGRPDGQPLTGPWVVVLTPEGGSANGVTVPVRDGRFRSDGLLATRWSVAARPADDDPSAEVYVTATPTVVAVSDGAAATLALSVVRGGVVRGRVVDGAGGGPLAGVELRGSLDGASRTGGRTRATTKTGVDGGFEVVGLATGRWTFESWSGTHASERWTFDLAPEGTEERVLTLAPWGTLRVTVVDGRGRGVEGAIVSVQREGQPALVRAPDAAHSTASFDPAVRARARLQTDAAGRAEVLVPPGELTVVARDDAAHEVSDATPVTTRSGAASEVQVTVRPRPRPEPRDR